LAHNLVEKSRYIYLIAARSQTVAVITLVGISISSSAGQQSVPSAIPNPGQSTAQANVPSTQLAVEGAIAKQLASLEKQRQAIQTQLVTRIVSGTSPPHPELLLPPLVGLNHSDCASLDSGKVEQLVSSAGQKQSLDPALLRAVIRQESAFKPCAVSSKGAQGLMQLMPSTARELHVIDAFDPVQNVHAGAAYLRQLLNRYNGDLRLALAGYNAGPARADHGIEANFPIETQNYVASILAEIGMIGDSEPSATQEDLAPPLNDEATNALKPK